MTDFGASIIASAIMVVVVGGGGQLIAPGASSPSAEAHDRATVACLDRPLIPVRDGGVRSMAQLCVTDGAVQPVVELADATPGVIYTTWLAVLAQPTTGPAGPCVTARPAASGEAATPGRLDGAVADQEGRVVLSHAVPGLRLDAASRVDLLVVEHAPTAIAGGAVQATRLVSWSPVWAASSVSVLAAGEGRGEGRLLGCASFWMRGGAEQTEH